MKLRAAVLAPALLFAAGACMAQAIDRPVYRVGDTWAYRFDAGSTTLRPGGIKQSTDVRKVVKVGERDMELVAEQTSDLGEKSTYTMTSSLDFNDYTSGPEHVEIRAWQWPIEPGKKWRYEYPSTLGTMVVEARAIGWEEVEVPAGRFRAMKVEREVASHSNSPSAAYVETVWFVPEVKANVKVTRQGSVRTFNYANLTRVLESFNVK